MPLTPPISHFDRYKRLVRDGKLFSVFILIALCTLIFNSSAHSQTIAGSSFETPSVASSGGFSFNPVGSGWTFTGDGGIQSNGGFLAQNDPSLPKAPDGIQTAFIESYPGTTTGTVSQSLNFPNAGTYSISFLACGWPGSSEPLQLVVDSVAVPGIFTPPADSYSPFPTSDFTIASSGSHTITFAGVYTGDLKVSLVDKVTIAHYLVTATTPLTTYPSVILSTGTNLTRTTFPDGFIYSFSVLAPPNPKTPSQPPYNFVFMDGCQSVVQDD